MKRNKIPSHLLFIRGSIGKKFVIRHTPWGILMTKFPDMSKIKASPAQRSCRNLFKEAVVWAKQVIADPVLKEAWQKKIRRRNGVYNAAITQYMLKEKAAMAAAEALKRKVTRKKRSKKPVVIIHRAIGKQQTILLQTVPLKRRSKPADERRKIHLKSAG